MPTSLQNKLLRRRYETREGVLLGRRTLHGHTRAPRPKALLFGEEFEFFRGAGPVFAEEAGEGAVGEKFSSGLAGGAVVGFVGGVADALDFVAATRAGEFVAAVDGHAFAEGGDVFGEFAGGFGAELRGPVREAAADGVVKAPDFWGAEFLREGERRKLGCEENFVGVGVADAGEEARVGERALEGVIGGEKDGGELVERGVEDFEAAGIEGMEASFAGDDVKGSAFLGAGFGPEQGTIGKVESGEATRRGDFDAARLPMETAGNHEMEDEPEVVFKANADAFAKAAEAQDFLAEGRGERRSGGTEQKRAGNAHGFEGLLEDAHLEGFEIDGDVGEFGHGSWSAEAVTSYNEPAAGRTSRAKESRQRGRQDPQREGRVGELTNWRKSRRQESRRDAATAAQANW